MKIVIFGLTISSSWGNGHATLWRGLVRALARRGCHITFFERDTAYYAGNRDLWELPAGRLVLYEDWNDVHALARREIASSDVALVTSYCPDAVAATELVVSGGALAAFYDLDTPVTLSCLRSGRPVPYLGPRGLRDFDLVLSYTGGPALEALHQSLGARRAEALYGHVDPQVHRPAAAQPHYRSHLSYLGTYAADRQPALETLLVDAARQRPDLRFLIGGAQYPSDFPWCGNIFFVRHLPPAEHPPFFSSSRLTLNITRQAMAEMGWCPSGRLFEAAACGTAVLSDVWPGLESFFTPGVEILPARRTEDTLAALALGEAEIRRIGEAARERVLAEHTSDRRADAMIAAFQGVGRSTAVEEA